MCVATMRFKDLNFLSIFLHAYKPITSNNHNERANIVISMYLDCDEAQD